MLSGFDIIDSIHPLTLARLKTNISLGVAVPSHKYLYAESQLYRDIASQLANLDCFYIYMSGVKAYGLTPLKNSQAKVEVGAVTQNTFEGISASAASNYLSMAAQQSWGSQFTNNSNTYGFYVSKAGTLGAANVYIGGGRVSDNSGWRIVYQQVSGNILHNNADTTNTNVFAGYFADNSSYASKRNGTTKSFDINGSQVHSITSASAGNAAQAPLFTLNARQVGSPAYQDGVPSSLILGAEYFGNGSLDTLVMHNAIHKLYTALN